MKIGFVVNDVMTEETGYTNTRLSCAAVNEGHEEYVFGVGDIAYDPDTSSALWIKKQNTCSTTAATSITRTCAGCDRCRLSEAYHQKSRYEE